MAPIDDEVSEKSWNGIYSVENDLSQKKLSSLRVSVQVVNSLIVPVFP